LGRQNSADTGSKSSETGLKDAFQAMLSDAAGDGSEYSIQCIEAVSELMGILTETTDIFIIAH